MLRAWMIAVVVVLGCGVAQEAEQVKPVASPYLVFDEAQLERYRVDIEQVTPDSGIETGYLFVYGYYIVPPYAVTAEAGTTRVNGVRIHPPMRLPPQEHNLPRNPWLDTEDGKRLLALDSLIGPTVREATATYGRSRRSGLGYCASLAVVESVALTNPLVESVRVRIRGVDVWGPTYTSQSGQTAYWYRSLDFPDTVYQASPPHVEPSQTLAESVARNLGEVLRAGGCAVYYHGLSGAKPSSYADSLADVMVRDELVAPDRWHRLRAFSSATEASACAANYEAARPAWQALAERLERERKP